MESRGPEDSKNVKTSQAYFFEGFISFFEDFSLTTCETNSFKLIEQSLPNYSYIYQDNVCFNNWLMGFMAFRPNA